MHVPRRQYLGTFVLALLLGMHVRRRPYSAYSVCMSADVHITFVNSVLALLLGTFVNSVLVKSQCVSPFDGTTVYKCIYRQLKLK